VNGTELKSIRITKGVSQQELADATGIPKGTIGRIESTGEDIKKVEVLESLHNYFNIETRRNSTRLEAVPLRLADPFGFEATGDRIYELADGSLMMEVPIIPIKAQAGYVHNYRYPEFYEELSTIPVMIEKKALSTYMAFEVKGDSMVNLSNYELAEKSIFPGRVAVGRLLDKSKWTSRLHTHTYNSWIIVHREKGIVCKEIIHHEVENGLITIHSLNPEYQDEVWDLADIDQIFSIVKIDQNKR
jgi:transcriptional regulator with XRE-family HTH domain